MPDIGTESINRLTPYLARLHETEKLYELARNRGPEARAELANAIADLSATTDLNIREQEIIADIMIGMMRQAERDLRMAIADRISALETAPLRVVLYLSNEEIEIAAPVLENSPVLEDMDLMYLIQSRSSIYWQAIARRVGLNAPVVRALVETRDTPTAQTLVGNDKSEIPADCYQVLADLAAEVEDLRAPLLRRPNIPAELVSRIYTYVGKKIENDLGAHVGPTTDAVSDAVFDATVELADAAVGNYEPSAMMLQAARALQARRQLNTDTMMKSLKLGQIASFIAQLSVFADLPLDRVREFLLEPKGETLAAICRLNNIDKRYYLKMYLLTQRYRNSERMVDPHILNAAMTNFDLMTLDKCRYLVNRHRALN